MIGLPTEPIEEDDDMETKMMDLELLTAAEVSQLTHIPVSTLHGWAAKREQGDGDVDGPPVYQLTNHRRFWSRADVIAWLESRRR